MKWWSVRIFSLLIFFFLLFGTAGTARASYGYVVLSVPNVLAGTTANLGTVLLSTTSGAVYEGDSLLIKLPSGFSFNWGSGGLDVDPVTGEARKPEYLLFVPNTVGGEPNGFNGQEWRVRRLDDNELILTLAVTNDYERLEKNDGQIILYLREINIPSGYTGDITLTADAPSSSGFPSGNMIVGRTAHGVISVSVESVAMVTYEATVNFYFKESLAGSFISSETSAVLRLPEGFAWTAAGPPQVIWGNEDWVAMLSFRLEGRDCIIDTVTGAAYSSNSPTYFKLPLTITVTNPAITTYGEVTVTLTGNSNLEPGELVVARYVDGTSPQVVGTTPVNGAADVPFETKVICVRFGEPIKIDYDSRFAITVTESAGQKMGFVLDTYYNELLICLTDHLAPSTTYAVYISSGAVTDLTGTPNDPFTFMFTTAAPAWRSPVEFTAGSNVVRIGESELFVYPPPYIKSSRFMVSLRGLSEALDLCAYWNPLLQIATFERGKSVRMRVGHPVMYVDNEVFHIDPLPEIQDGSVFVPARYVAEAFGYICEEDHSNLYMVHPAIDQEPPGIIAADPSDGSAGVSTEVQPAVTFGERVRPYVNLAGVVLQDAAGRVVPAHVEVSRCTLTLKPDAPLAAGVDFLLTIPAGAVADIVGNVLAETITVRFRTAAGGGSGGGSGAPATTPAGIGTETGMLSVVDGKATLTVEDDKVKNLLSDSRVSQIVFSIPKEMSDKKGTVIVAADTLNRVFAADRSALVEVGGVRLTLPPGAFELSPFLDNNASLKFTVEKSTAPAPEDPAYMLGGGVFNITIRAEADDVNLEEAVNLRKPVVLTLSYDPAKLGKIQPEYLGIYRFSGGSWEYVGGKIDKSAHTVSVSRLNLSTYAIFAYEKEFADLAGHWAGGDIKVMAARHVVAGVTETVFAPEAPITRAEFATLVIRALSVTEDKASGGRFKDVDPDSWYAGAVETAAVRGLVKGYPDGTFKPAASITRAELAALAVRALESIGQDVTVSAAEQKQLLARYEDRVQVREWAAADLARAVNAGLVRGTSANIVDPHSSATRAQAIVVIKRLMEKANLL